MPNSIQLFQESLDWLRSTYNNHLFFVERDLVWTLQKRLIALFDKPLLDCRVFNDYGVLPGKRRSISTDIAIVRSNGGVDLAAEFKYEPSHSRTDIPSNKFPVVFWGKEGVGKDVQRIRDFISKGNVSHAYSIFIDEGGYFKSRQPHTGSRWIHWQGNTWVLYSEVHNK